jgi:2-methylcitrate dehydratase PrpD
MGQNGCKAQNNSAEGMGWQMFLVDTLAKHVVGLHYARLPPEVVARAKRCLLDTIGNMIGGRFTAKGDLINQYAVRWSNTAEATVVGSGKVHREAAAFANAVLARMLDLDDGHRFAFGHPAGILVSTALALGEVSGASGRDLIVALVAGYDVYAGLGKAINPSSYHERGFDATGVAGSVAVAAVAAQLYKLDEKKTKDALGIAALQAGGIIEYQNDGTMGKVLCPGWATSTGIKAADLADLGFTGPEAVFEGKKGFFQAFSNKYEASRLTEQLGEKHGILQNYFKLHACMRGLHCAVDAVLSLKEAYSLHAANVQKIRINSSSFVERLNKPHPQTIVGAQCSLPFSVAVALKYGGVNEQSIGAGMNDAEIGAIEDRVEVVIDDKVQAYWAKNPDHWAAVELEITTKDGRQLVEWVPVASGEPEKPLSWEQLQAKFSQLVSPTKFRKDMGALLETIAKFDEVKNIRAFAALLGGKQD